MGWIKLPGGTGSYETPEGAQAKADAAETSAKAYTDVFAARRDNPHQVTKSQVGLDKVTNVEQASLSQFNEHASDTIKHTSNAERQAWNEKETPGGAQAKADNALSAAKEYTETFINNRDNHAVIEATSSTQTITQNVETVLTILDSVISQKPVESTTTGSGTYKVPESGTYVFHVTLRPTELTQPVSVLRVGLNKTVGEEVTKSPLMDLLATNATSNGYVSGSFLVNLNKDDSVTVFVNALTEDVTLQQGTRVQLFYLGSN
ncbi:hypothetical protein F373_gp077 [Bacillus phage SP-10]|uniref:hypothetical protein n=1 Tax=Bacillus phage SP10 TaxID=941058 RepID=UPI0002198B21|nr:hypothetical protein F373_gp077 [Bacillus phage SP-10]BAK52889.1 hypothetical protein [Bacillus phage SP-10]